MVVKPVEFDVQLLRDVINPSSTVAIFKTFCPWTASKPLDFNEVGKTMSDLPIEEIRRLCIPALVALSTHPAFTPLKKDPSHRIPSLLPLLDSSKESFPQQALGLQLLLDQAPRALFEDVDARWTFAYFDYISEKVALEVYHMKDGPLEQDSWSKIGYIGIGHWIYYRTWFNTPFVHADSPSFDEPANHLIDSSWKVIEKEGSKNDWWKRYQNAKPDPTAFVPVLRDGAEKIDGKVTTETYLFWWMKVMATRKTVRNVFGRHPTRNGYFDRASTDEEKKFLEEIEYWGSPSQDVVEKIKQDIEDGIWRSFKAE